MKFSEIVAQAIAWLQREERVSYRALKREFDLDDETLEDLKAELIDIKETALDKDGKMVIWRGQRGNATTEGEKGKRRNGKRRRTDRRRATAVDGAVL